MWQELQIFLLAMTPIGELRAAIPVGVGVYHLNWLLVFLISVIGNLTPILFLLLFLRPLSEYLSVRVSLCKHFFVWLFERTQKKHHRAIERYGWWGLMAFVAIPLPMTGGWSGALIAFLTGMPFWQAFSAIAVGVVVAGTVVSLVVKTGLVVGQYFGWQILIVILLVVAVSWLIFRKVRNKK
ncbi:MAG: small multi-drug export protein [Candidatus Pacebacteria bacterium]|nr:small multi-drug export protein [Candidatus Paceibacterota bacterium]